MPATKAFGDISDRTRIYFLIYIFCLIKLIEPTLEFQSAVCDLQVCSLKFFS